MARSSFKQEHPQERREAEAQRIREKYPDRIPVIVERSDKVRWWGGEGAGGYRAERRAAQRARARARTCVFAPAWRPWSVGGGGQSRLGGSRVCMIRISEQGGRQSRRGARRAPRQAFPLLFWARHTPTLCRARSSAAARQTRGGLWVVRVGSDVPRGPRPRRSTREVSGERQDVTRRSFSFLGLRHAPRPPCGPLALAGPLPDSALAATHAFRHTPRRMPLRAASGPGEARGRGRARSVGVPFFFRWSTRSLRCPAVHPSAESPHHAASTSNVTYDDQP